MKILAGSFSLNMIDRSKSKTIIERKSISLEDIPKDAMINVGRKDVAEALSKALGITIERNPQTFTLQLGDTLYVAQRQGKEGELVFDQVRIIGES